LSDARFTREDGKDEFIAGGKDGTMERDTLNGQVDGIAMRRDVLLAFEYSHTEDDWVFPLAEALEGLTAQEAAWTPAGSDPETRSIWRIVLHMTVWTENIVERMAQRTRGEQPGRPSEGAWPELPEICDDTAWAAAQQRLSNALASFRAHITETPPAALLDQGNVGYSQLADLLCRFAHNAYHIGQITKLREWKAAKD
jgi:uncharacterized damage-inducible protein DinB